MKGDSLRDLNVKPKDYVEATLWNKLVRRVADMSGFPPAGRRSAPGSSSITLPFDISFDSTALTFTLWPGTVNSFVPTNMFSVFPYVALTTTYIKLSCVTDGSTVTSASIVVDTSAPSAISTAQSAGPTSFDVLIGVIVNSVAYKTWEGGNVNAVTSLALTTEKASPTPGLSPFVYWYTWTVTVQ